MQEFANTLAARFGLASKRDAAATRLLIERPDGLRFEVTIPDDVLEWFASLGLGDRVLWEEWGDYYALEGESQEQLCESMKSDLERFLSVACSVPLRLDLAQKPEWCLHGQWSTPAIAAT